MKISKSMIDAVLRVGDHLHSALTEALGVPGQRLSFEEIKAAIRKIGEEYHIITFPQTILTGDVFSTSAEFPFVTLEEGIQSALQSDTGALLRILEYTVAILKLPEGSFAGLILMQEIVMASWMAMAVQRSWNLPLWKI